MYPWFKLNEQHPICQTFNIILFSSDFSETLQSLFLDSFPTGIAAIAIIRFRLAICRGNADILVNRAFFLNVSVSCALLSLIVVITKLFVRIATTDFRNSSKTGEYCFDVRFYGMNYLNLASTMLMYVVPSALITGLYTGLVRISSSSITRIQQFRQAACAPNHRHTAPRISIFGRPSIMPAFSVQNQIFSSVAEHQTRGARIRQSVITLVAFFLISTLPVSTLEIYKSLVYCNHPIRIALLYLKTMMCILHAIGEGAFHKEKRRRIMMFLNKYLSTSTSTSVIKRMSNDVRRTVIFHTNAQLSTLKEESIENQSLGERFEGSLTVTQDDVFTNGDESPRHETGDKKMDLKYGSTLSVNTLAKSKDKKQGNRSRRSTNDSYSSTVKQNADRYKCIQSPDGILRSPQNKTSPNITRRCQGSSFLKQNMPLIAGHRRNGGKFSPLSPNRRAMPHIEETFLYEYPVPTFSFIERHSEILESPKTNNVIERRSSSASFLDVDEQLTPQMSSNDREILQSSIQRISVICDTM